MYNNTFSYGSEDLLFRIVKAIDLGMTDAVEYRERFGTSKMPLAKLKEKGLIEYSRSAGYFLTSAGKKWMVEYKKCKH